MASQLNEKHEESTLSSPAASSPELAHPYGQYDEKAGGGGVLPAQRRPRFSRSSSPSRASVAPSMLPGGGRKGRGGPIVVSSNLLKGPIAKPWLKPARYAWVPRALFIALSLLGGVLGGVQIYFGVKSVPRLGNVCLVLDEQFAGNTLDPKVWTREVGVDGWGNGEFEWSTDDDANARVEDGVLYITPTLTEEKLGKDAIFDGYNLTVAGCTTGNGSQCWVASNATAGTVINPVMSARLSTRLSKSVKYGRIEVRARMPRGDWLWPAIWMMPKDNVYGAWPRSGEIDIIESRGNGPSYPSQGRDWLSSALHWGPAPLLDAYIHTTGWWHDKHLTFDAGFHTYVLEWDEQFLWTYIDSRGARIFNHRFHASKPFFARGNFPSTVFNGTHEVRLENPWAGSPSPGVAPFDQSFYLILDVAVGGTNGWFPDGKGKKPWVNGAATAMRDFARAQDTWYPSWPADLNRRALAVEYVKMYQKC
ncbi:concanavalin A-like lectin/glucanase [Auricularia subglabra TFB-10046 SS5]|nr:concanavalin A-like lectin/glucanase [Auricularia subglabra TFB-10046 SS5]